MELYAGIAFFILMFAMFVILPTILAAPTQEDDDPYKGDTPNG